MLIVLTGDSGVGKKTIASILQKTEGFKIVDIVDADFTNFEDRVVAVVKPEEFFERYWTRKSIFRGSTTDIVLQIEREGVEEIQNIPRDTEQYKGHANFVVNNGDIVEAIKTIVQLHDNCQEIYKHYFRSVR